MISIEAYTNDEGRTDWEAYRAAQLQAGEYCMSCGAGIVFPKGQPTTCGECRWMAAEEGEVCHGGRLRCPACRHQWDVADFDVFDLYEEGRHEIMCPECEHEFTVSTDVSYTFTSPGVDTAAV